MRLIRGLGFTVSTLAFAAACGSDGGGGGSGDASIGGAGAGGESGSTGTGGGTATGGFVSTSGGATSAGGTVTTIGGSTGTGGTATGGAAGASGGATSGGSAGASGSTGTGGGGTGGSAGAAGSGAATGGTGGVGGFGGSTPDAGEQDASTDAGTDAGSDAGTDSGGTSPTVAFAASTGKTWEGTGKWDVVVALSAASATDVTVHYEAGAASTATGGGTDYTMPAGTLTIAAGQTTANIELTVVNDAASETDETVAVVLSAPTRATLGAQSTYVLTLVDDGLHAWPGPNNIVTVDPAANTFGQNMSDLSYQPAAGAAPAVMWAVQNSPSTLYRLVQTNGKWGSTTTDNWTAGKQLFWPGVEQGSPDTEGLTKADYASSSIYVSTERDNNTNKNTNRYSVLRYDTSAAGATLTAAQEWNLTADIPTVNASNVGLEAITWVPDSFLTGRGFYDEGKAKKYAPADYPNHGTGIFLVGLEATGVIYGYVLDDGGTFHKVATIASGLTLNGGNGSNIMGLSFDRDVGQLWALCDDHCSDATTVLNIETNPLSPSVGKFQVRRTFSRPGGIPANMNNEGMAFAPESECANGFKTFYWTDDGLDNGLALRSDAIPCGDFL